MGLTDKHLVYGNDIPDDIQSYREGICEGYDKGYADAKQKYQRPQGEWIEGDIWEIYDVAGRWQKCSICGDNERYKRPFCPNCGADMTGGAEDD